MRLFDAQRILDQQVQRGQSKDSHVKESKYIGRRAFEIMFPPARPVRLCECIYIKIPQRFSDTTQKSGPQDLQPAQALAVVFVGKFFPGTIAINNAKIGPQNIDNRRVLFENGKRKTRRHKD
jgi:hypothetical protein